MEKTQATKRDAEQPIDEAVQELVRRTGCGKKAARRAIEKLLQFDPDVAAKIVGVKDNHELVKLLDGLSQDNRSNRKRQNRK